MCRRVRQTSCEPHRASLYQLLALTGRYRSGQTGQTVNLLALRLRWFESSPAQILFRSAEMDAGDLTDLCAGRDLGDHSRRRRRRRTHGRHHRAVALLGGELHLLSAAGLPLPGH